MNVIINEYGKLSKELERLQTRFQQKTNSSEQISSYQIKSLLTITKLTQAPFFYF